MNFRFGGGGDTTSHTFNNPYVNSHPQIIGKGEIEQGDIRNLAGYFENSPMIKGGNTDQHFQMNLDLYPKRNGLILLNLQQAPVLTQTQNQALYLI